MPSFRCYFLNAANHIVGVEICDCPDDAAATRWAERIGRNGPPTRAGLEIWCRDRMVQRQEFSASIATNSRRDEFRQKARSARARAALEADEGRHRGLAAIAEQYEKLADEVEFQRDRMGQDEERRFAQPE